MSHGNRVDALPPGFTATASTSTIPFAAMSDERRRYYGVQFHPEVTHTTPGARLLERFCARYPARMRSGARATSAALLHRAIGD